MTDAAAVERLTERRWVGDSVAQLRRGLLPIVVTDTLVAYLVQQHAPLGAAVGWWVAIVAWTVHRHLTLDRWADPPAAHVQRALQRMRRLAGVLGLLRAVPIVIVFATADDATRLLVSMIMLGLATGAMASSGGDRLTLLHWGVPVFAALSIGWLAQRTPIGVLLAVLLLYLFRVLLAYVDMTGRQSARLIEAAEQLRIERDRASLASEAKTRFLAAASHDLRQPLYALGLYAATLDELAIQGSDERLHPVRQGIRRALEHSRSLLDSLLDISRLEALAVEVKPQVLPLASFLRGVVQAHVGPAVEKDLALECRVAPALEGRALRSDPALLTRLLGNLLDNAIKFTERGGVVVTLAAGATPEHACIEVSDTGPGIAPDEQERVFEEFYQIGNPERDRSRGLGLGLAIVARLARLLDAGIELRSASGQGASFRVELGPLLAEAPASSQVLAAEPGAVAAIAGRVLVIDDEADIRAGLAGLLGLRGWTVLVAGGSAEALALLRNGPAPEVLLVDYRLGGETGIEAIRRLQDVFGPLPAVLVTGDTAPERIVESGEAGYPVLHKPVDPQAVVEALRRALGGARGPA